MISIFSTLKPMNDPVVAQAQRNAVTSWANLPHAEVILIGDEFGVADLAQEVGTKHVDTVERHFSGMPMLPDLFRVGWASSLHQICVYVNADIILLDNFVDTVHALLCFNYEKFLAVGRRLNVVDVPVIDFDTSWQADLLEHAEAVGAEHDSYAAADYFIHTKGLWTDLTSIPIARFFWDDHLIWLAGTAEGAPVIDVSGTVTAIHQFHALIAWFDDPVVQQVGEKVAHRTAGINHAKYVMQRDGDTTTRW